MSPSEGKAHSSVGEGCKKEVFFEEIAPEAKEEIRVKSEIALESIG